MAPMSQLVLVIVVVAAGIVLAAVISLRAGKMSRSGNPAKDGVGERAPANGGPTLGRGPAPANVPPETLPATASSAPGPVGATTSPNSKADPTSATMSFDASDLDFALMPPADDVAPTTGVAPAAAPPLAAAAGVARSTGSATSNSTTQTMRALAANSTTQTMRALAASPDARAAQLAGGPPPDAPEILDPSVVFGKLFELMLGKARQASEVTAGHQDVADATAAALQDAATQQRYAPRRPNMLPRVLSASNDESFSRRDLAALIARDPSLVGNLLKIANSSFYRVTPEPVESVDRAVVLLGTDGIRSLVTAALMQPIFRIGGADFPRFPEVAWEHTFRAANASVPYNFLVEKSDPAVAELLSLVMGLAGIVVFRVTIDQYAKYPRLRPDAGVIAWLLDTHSASVARQIGASWELSESTLTGLDGQSTSTSKYPTPLGRSLYFGRLVGALAVLRINHVIDDETAKASIPVTTMPEAQLERMWTRLTPKLDK
jgi:hypothetical protein